MSVAAGARYVGTGLRKEVWADIIEHAAEFEVLEVTVDHYIHAGPRLRERFVAMAEIRPLVVHGVGLSIGTAAKPDEAYLDAVAEFIDLVGAPWYSEHLAFTRVPGRESSQLIPLPRTRRCADAVLENLAVVRRHVPVPLVLENITYYFTYPTDEMSELAFLTEVLGEAGAFLLLDLENLYINSRNHGFDAVAFIDALPPGAVRAVHLAGGMEHDGLLIDSHNRPVPDEVFALLSHLLSTQSPDTIVVERDDDLAAFEDVVADCRRARAIVADVA